MTWNDMFRPKNDLKSRLSTQKLTSNDLILPQTTTFSKTTLYEQHNPALHGPQINRKQKICTKLFMKKYIAVAKMIQPKIKTEAAALLAEEYARLRSHECMEDGQGGGNGNARTTPVTARTLETLIRLATAHAKIRLAKTVVKKDAKVAIELVQYAYFQKVFEKPKRGGGKRKNAEEEQNNDDSDMSDEEDETIASVRMKICGMTFIDLKLT